MRAEALCWGAERECGSAVLQGAVDRLGAVNRSVSVGWGPLSESSP